MFIQSVVINEIIISCLTVKIKNDGEVSKPHPPTQNPKLPTQEEEEKLKLKTLECQASFVSPPPLL